MGSVAVGTILATIGGGLALEDRVKYTIAAALLFPPALLLYFPLVGIASQVPSVRVAMVLIAVGLVGLIVKGTLSRTQPRAATPARRVVRLA